MAAEIDFFNGNENEETRSAQEHDRSQTGQGCRFVVARRSSR